MQAKPFIRLALACAAVLASAACAGPTPTPTAPLATLIQVDLAEWSVTPLVTQTGAGPTNVLVMNRGTLEHELIVLKTDRPGSDLIVVDGKVDEAASGTVIGEIEPDQLQPGQQASVTWDLEPGKYVLFCNITGHYALGMRAGLTIVN